LPVRPQAGERRRAVAVIGIPTGLEVVDADLRRGVRVPAGLRVEGRDVAARAAGFSREELPPALRRWRAQAARGGGGGGGEGGGGAAGARRVRGRSCRRGDAARGWRAGRSEAPAASP